MATVRDIAIALNLAAPDALVIESMGTPGTIIHGVARPSTIPEFVVCRGFILTNYESAPTRTPAMKEDEVIFANVEALLKYRIQLVSSAQNAPHGPIRTLITLRDHEDPDSVYVGMWIY